MRLFRFGFIFFILLIHFFCDANLQDHFKKIENKVEFNQMRNIDFIYLINLDKRKDRLEHSIKELAPYNITPHRFSAVYGIELPLEVINDIGLVYQKGMTEDQKAFFYPMEGDGNFKRINLSEIFYGKTVFSHWMRPGAIGCALSHLSVLQDAFDSQYNAIWVLEDDFIIIENPHTLSDYMDKLDELAGEDGWDMLFTDLDPPDDKIASQDLKKTLWFMCRPDFPNLNSSKFAKRKIISDEFIEVASRTRFHSIIIKRTGIEKILNFFKANKLYLPYDHDLFYTPDLKLFMLRKNLVTFGNSPSDIQGQKKICY